MNAETMYRDLYTNEIVSAFALEALYATALDDLEGAGSAKALKTLDPDAYNEGCLAYIEAEFEEVTEAEATDWQDDK